MKTRQESIFLSGIRSLCKSLGTMIGIIVGLALLAGVFMFISKPAQVSEKTILVIAPDDTGNRELLPPSTPVILRINIHGIIGSRDVNGETIKAQLLDSREGMFKHDRVKAVILDINSPGGLSTDGQMIYQLILAYKEKYKVPVYAFTDGLCASAGMLIACAADKIYTSSTGIIGSVGVRFGPVFNYSGIMEKYGVSQITLTRGKDKDALNPFRPLREDEDISLQRIIDYEYDLFVNDVVKNRPRITRENLINEYGAQVFSPPMAEELGFVDVSGSTYEDTLVELRKAAEIPDDQKYQVIELRVVHPVLSELIEGQQKLLSGKIQHELSLPGDLPAEFAGKILYLYSPTLDLMECSSVPTK